MKLIVLSLLVLVASSAIAKPRSGNYQGRLSGESSSSSSEENSRNDIGRVPHQLLERIPSAGEILTAPLESLKERRDVDVLANTVHQICAVAKSTNVFKPNYYPRKEQIKVHLLSKQGETIIPLSQPERLLETSFDDDKFAAVFITGWKMTMRRENSPLMKIREAYKCRGNTNLIVIDIGEHIPNLQTWMNLDVEEIGQWVGQFLEKLTKKTPVNKVHILGQGVGAHVAGAAARKYYEITGNMIPRITALDPTRLCYRQHMTVPGLQQDDAEFVDAIHTTAYGLGMEQTIGDVDFFPNGPSAHQPASRNLILSHLMAVEYFAESIAPGTEESFVAKKCNSMKNLHNKTCQREEIPMGLATPRNARGNFFLQTESVSPFGNNARSQRKECRASN